MTWHHRAALHVLLVLVLATAARGVPDRSTGVINGKKAVMFWPKNNDVTGCVARLVPFTNPATELSFPCGEWFLPPVGQYRAWIETSDTISPVPLVLNHRDEPFQGTGLLAVLETVPSGEVGLLRASGEAATFRALSIDTFRAGATLQRSFDRRVKATDSRPVRMPTGRIVAGLFDDKGDAITLSRPTTLAANQIIHPSLSVPRATNILVILERPKTHNSGEQEVDVHLSIDEKAATPDVLIDAADRIIAIWYEQSGRHAQLRTKSTTLMAKPVDLPIAPGRTYTVRSTLTALPKLQVRLNAPEPLTKPTLTVKTKTGQQVFTAPVTESTMIVPAVPAEQLEVTLASEELTVRERADASDGADKSVAFDVTPFSLTGTVTRRGKGIPATITVAPTSGKPAVVNAERNGKYTARLWAPGVYRVWLESAGISKHVYEARQFDRDETYDITVPGADITVDVTNARDGKSVSKARVAAGTTYKDHDGKDRRRWARVETDNNGSAALTPLDPGPLTVVVEADGFQKKELQATAAGTTTPQHISVALDPLGDTTPLTILRPDGTPAAGAQVALSDGEQLLWTGETDTNGRIEIAKRSGNLLVRDTQSSIACIAPGPEHITLGPPAEPLTANFTVNGGPAKYTIITLTLGPCTLRGNALNFLTGRPGMSDASGRWSVALLPREPIRVIAVTQQAMAAAQSGAMNHFTVTIPWPWPMPLPDIEAAH